MRHHDGAFDIRLDGEGRPVFVTPQGREIAPPTGPPLRGPSRPRLRKLLGDKAEGITAETCVARDHGERMDLSLTVELLHFHCARLGRESGESVDSG